jgi:hypothetical protein
MLLPAVSAVLSSDSSEVCFGVPNDVVDWDAIADSALGRAFIQNPPVKELRRHHISEWGSSAFPFSRALSPKASAMDWLLVRESGLVVVHPTILKGRVAFSVDKRFVVHTKASEDKEACAPIATEGGGFVFSGVAARGWRVDSGPHIAPLTSRQTNRYRFAATIDGQAYLFTVEYETTVLLSRLVRRGPQAFLLIKWKDIGDCSDHYHLFAVRPVGELRLVSESVGDCRGD